ncbi:MAG: gene transfer agent family protein [Cypionkella sp.]|nr:gene transfer agent family protein [Cypionkella sp.]
MGNPFAGEVSVRLDGVDHPAKLTLGALAELEAALGEDSLLALVERFEAGRFSSRDVLALVVAGLRGGGWRGAAVDLTAVTITDAQGAGPLAAARIAAQLLARAFALPEG